MQFIVHIQSFLLYNLATTKKTEIREGGENGGEGERDRVLKVSASMRMYLLFQQTEGGNFSLLQSHSNPH